MSGDIKNVAANDTQPATTWRRRWDSNPRAGSSPAKRFRVVLVMTSSIRLHMLSLNFRKNPRAEKQDRTTNYSIFRTEKEQK